MFGEKNVPNKVVMSYAKRGHFESQKSNYKEVAIFIVYFNFFFNSWFLLFIYILYYILLYCICILHKNEICFQKKF